MSKHAAFRVMFRAAAGPRCGFGHLVRCGALASALEVHREISLRGPASPRRVARDLGWTLVDNALARLATHPPELLIVDDPSAIDAARWVRRARHYRIPVATVHDLGLARVPLDLTIDGGIGQIRGSTPSAAMLRETPAISIAGRRVAEDLPPIVIAGIGINHGRSIDDALALVDAAAAVGAPPTSGTKPAGSVEKGSDPVPAAAACRSIPEVA